MFWIIPLLLLVVFESLADYISKTWSLKGGVALAVLALVGYVVANAFWLWALKSGAGLARGAVLFSVLSAVLAVALGFIVFKEDVGVRGYVGIAMGVVAIGLLSYK